VRGLVDANCHLDDTRVADVEALLARAAAAGVGDVVSTGVHPRRDKRELPGRRGGPRVWRAVGLHPQGAADLEDCLPLVEERAALPGVIAIGEIGLDRREGMPVLALQRRALEAQLELARGLGLPVVLHEVRAHAALLEVLDRCGPLAAGGYLHGYTGPAELVDEWLAHGLSLSFGGMVTNPRARRCRAAAAAVPLDRLLVESDTPDHPPRGLGSAQSEPAGIALVLFELARLRGAQPEALAAATADNARRLLGLPAPGPLLTQGQ
jgi:TatD DNase family protein